MKTKLLLLTALGITYVNSFAQTSLFFDNFDPAVFPVNVTSNKAFTASTPSSIVSDAIGDWTGYNSATDGFYLSSGNGTSGLNCIWNATASTFTTNLSIQASTTASYRGTSTVSMPLSKISAPFNPILKNNTNVITWSFGMRINRSSQLTPFSTALNSGAALSGGVILATTAADNLPIAAADSPSNGYAVIFSGSNTGTTTNRIDFGNFTGGLSYNAASSSSTFNSLLFVDNIPIGGNAISVIVTYNPSTNSWGLSVRQDGSSSIIDPDTVTTNAYTSSTPASAFDSLYTSITMNNMMLFFNHNATNGLYIDNLKIKSDANLNTSKNEISGLNVYPNPVTNGKLFLITDSLEDKSVTIYDLLGKVILQNQVSNGSLDVTTLKKGVYLLKISQGTASSNRKLIID